MSALSQEAQEKRHVASFWKHLNEFPNNAPQKQKPPEPDFFVETNEGLIGIEHTRLVRQKDERGVDIMGHYRCAERIMEQAEQGFRAHSDLKLHVLVSFACTYGLVTPKPIFLSNQDIRPLATFITEFVAHHIPPSKEHWQFEDHDPYRNTFNFPLDKKIRSISIRNIDYLISQPCWSPTQAAMIPRVYESEAFKIRLKKKNEKPRNYQKDYYQIWLLIIEDQRDLATYFDFEYGEQPTASSPFDRIFVFRYATKEIIKLKVAKV